MIYFYVLFFLHSILYWFCLLFFDWFTIWAQNSIFLWRFLPWSTSWWGYLSVILRKCLLGFYFWKFIILGWSFWSLHETLNFRRNCCFHVGHLCYFRLLLNDWLCLLLIRSLMIQLLAFSWFYLLIQKDGLLIQGYIFVLITLY